MKEVLVMTAESARPDDPRGTGLPGKETTAETIVLVVDDSPVDRRLAAGIVENQLGWKAAYAGNGTEALAAIAKQQPAVVLTDLLMPEMDGLELVEAVRSKYPLVPVILMTAHGSEDIAIKALQKGAASYVPKKSLARDLPETLEQVLTTSKADRHQQRLLECLTRVECHFVLDNDSALIPPLIGHLEENITRMRLCDPSGLILVGVALHEALTNAIFHGNLEVSSAMREQDERAYYDLAQQRRQQEPYRSRRVYVHAELSRLEATFVVRDEGPGFDPSSLPDPTDPSNLERVSGRGLFLIRTFMDQVTHNEVGNQITMVKRRYR
jgi:CheY-like chemotaxis protein/anti-sigma regulatory factor (Ser/Thr protein kinase)